MVQLTTDGLSRANLALGSVPAGVALAYLGQPATPASLTAPLNISSSNPDTDADGCGDTAEVALALDPTSPWDFYSVPVPALMFAPSPLTTFRDNTVGAADAQAVFAYFKAGAKAGKTVYDQDLDGNGIADGIEYDRSVAGPGMSGAPDGIIGAAEAQLAFAQFKKAYHC